MVIPTIHSLFTAYLGPVVIPGISVNKEGTITMQVVTENIVVRCIDAAANNLTAKTVRTIQNLASLQTTTISVTDNRFYGLVCALV